MIGKHSPEGQEMKKLQEENEKLKMQLFKQDLATKKLKNKLADEFQKIRDISESNDYGDPSWKKRKIAEICTDNVYNLRKEMIEEYYKKEELSTTDQSK